jgi:REP element-mobilizing transposase RayT
MSSYHCALYHIIFRTKNSHKTLCPQFATELFSYIVGIAKNKKIHVYRINGTENHIHLLCDLHPDIALGNFMRDMKSCSSVWLKASGKFPQFAGWSVGYAALTYGWSDKDRIIGYIKNQQEHHKKTSFEEELRKFLLEYGIEINELFFP